MSSLGGAGVVGVVGVVGTNQTNPTNSSEQCYTHTFDQPGVYNVTCDIHSTMHAMVHVASTPYMGTADERGLFTFEQVVPGSYKVTGFADGSPIEKVVDIAGASVDVHLQ